MTYHKYSVKEFEEHKIELDRIAELWNDNYSAKGKNPYSAQAKKASEKLRNMETYLKRNGLINYTEHELLEETLNQQYPKAQSKEIVMYDGVKYKKKFSPIELSKTGKSVKKWRSGWEALDGE
jgi:hypothetical protein